MLSVFDFKSMKVSLAVLVAATVFLPHQQPTKTVYSLKHVYKVGERHTYEMTMTVGTGADAFKSISLEDAEVLDLKDGLKIKLRQYQNRFEFDGQIKNDSTERNITLRLKQDGRLDALDGADPDEAAELSKSQMIMSFYPPEKSISVGETYSRRLEKGPSPHTVPILGSFTLDGGEDANGQPCLRVKAKIDELEGEAKNTFDGYFWVSQKDYTLVKFEGVVTNRTNEGDSTTMDVKYDLRS